MYRIAFFSDLHANFPALKAIMQKIQEIGVDTVISLGDVISIGPHPKQCVELLFENEIGSLIGNHEEFLIKGLSKSNKPLDMDDGDFEQQIWTHDQISTESYNFIATWQYRHYIEIDSVKILFLHSPYIKNDGGFTNFVNTRQQNKNEIDFSFQMYNADVICLGHTHLFVDLLSKKRYINPGSVGCHKYRFAHFSILEIENGLVNAFHYQVPYDKNTLIRDLEESHIPNHKFLLKTFF